MRRKHLRVISPFSISISPRGRDVELSNAKRVDGFDGWTKRKSTETETGRRMDKEEIDGLVSLQKRELMAARDVESNLELAFRLWMQEAMSASLSFQPSNSASSSMVSPSLAESVAHDDEPFSLYFKGLVRDEIVRGSNMVLSGIGAAICDPCGTLIFKVLKPLVGDGMSSRFAAIKALIEGLNAGLSLNIKRINFYCDYHPLYQFGFDEYMNLVLEDAEEVNIKKKTKKQLGRILLKGDNITLMQNT